MQLTRYIGHTDVRTTKNIYGKLFPGDGQRVAAALDAYLERGVSGVRAPGRWSEIGLRGTNVSGSMRFHAV
jgi:hypothetical protein